MQPYDSRSFRYGGLTNDELLNVATDEAALTSEALNALKGELTRRSLTANDVKAYAEETAHLEKQTGNMTLGVPIGVGQVFLGEKNLKTRGSMEEVDTTRWVLLFWVPAFPVAAIE